MTKSLDQYSTDDLAKELHSREDLVKKNGTLSDETYQLSTELCIMPCVDGIAIRRNKGVIEALAIRRNTGPFTGKLCSVGGRILFEESFEDSLKRHFRTDLGVEINLLTPWDKPATVYQFARTTTDGHSRKNFGIEVERRHCVNVVYIVKLHDEKMFFGQNTVGYQEVHEVEWFSLANIPPSHNFGYGQDVYFRKCLLIAETLL